MNDSLRRLLWLTALCALPLQAQEVVGLTATSDVRAGPGALFAPLGRAGFGQRYVAVRRSGAWTTVHFDGRAGWIESARLRPASQGPGLAVRQARRAVGRRSGGVERVHDQGGAEAGERGDPPEAGPGAGAGAPPRSHPSPRPALGSPKKCLSF